MDRRIALAALLAALAAACEAPEPPDGPDASLSTTEGDLSIACGGPKDLKCPQGTWCQARPGACDTSTSYGSCVAAPAECPAIGPTVCGCDGTPYANTCERQAAGVSEGPEGACGTVCTKGDGSCAAGEVCDIMGCGGKVGTCATAPMSCARTWAPVCGCNGKTYANDCQRLAAGAALAGDGACPAGCGGPTATPCKAGYTCARPTGVCSELAYGACVLTPRLCLQKGPAVCGCDGMTWPSACAALVAGETVASDGPCGDLSCAPCMSDADCGSGSGLACVSRGDEGSFCAAPCAAGACGDGATCQSAETVDGTPIQACLPDGPCGCTDTAIAAGSTTACAVTNADGSCSGMRKCTPNGLSPCNAATPVAELCNGKDDNCDGVIDEGNPGGGMACSTGNLGVCAAGTTSCSKGAIVCAQVTQPTAEVCDGKDNNCDGQIDEGNPGGGVACNTGKLGVCAAGVTACSQGAVTCQQSTMATAEVCGNGKDDDCNGQVDDGCDKPVTWTNDASPIYQMHCTPCHTDFASGGANFATSYADSQLASYRCTGLTKGACTIVRIKLGEMPKGAGCSGDPTADAGNAACLSAAEQAVLQKWIDGGQQE